MMPSKAEHTIQLKFGGINNMSNIKITVEYEQPKTDNFFNLLNQYEEVTRLSNETVSYYKPLAETAEKAKMTAILEQLETIKNYLIQLHKLDSDTDSVEVHCPGKYTTGKFSLDIVSTTEEVRIWWRGILFNLDNLSHRTNVFNANSSQDYNILGNWDKWEVYKKLEAQCIFMLKFAIKLQKERAERAKARLENITNN